MTASAMDSFRLLDTFACRSETFPFFNLGRLEQVGLMRVSRLPYAIRILLEAVVRSENGREITRSDVERFLRYDPRRPAEIDIPFLPARVLLQDFTGVPCIVDLAAMRAEIARRGLDPQLINPVIPVDLVVDHSVQVDRAGRPDALAYNEELDYRRNRERYEFLRWGQRTFCNMRVIPPGSGICHQVNLEYLASVAGPRGLVYSDTVLGTDSHTTMINGLGVLGWGVGGIEAEAAMLGQPVCMLAPPVMGVRLSGALAPGVTATDAVLYLTEFLRSRGVVGKIVEFLGPGLDSMGVADRATLANMAPEYGATAAFFPVDGRTLEYLEATGRAKEHIDVVEAYCRAQGLFRTDDTMDYESLAEIDLASIEPALAGPKRPQDRIALGRLPGAWPQILAAPVEKRGYGLTEEARARRVRIGRARTDEVGHGAVLLAAITSCTNTSNPAVMVAAGLLAAKAVDAGLSCKPWVKTSLSPGSLAVTDYLRSAALLEPLESLGFHVTGYGCMTCIGNSGPLDEEVADAVKQGGLVAASVLSGNRNFEGRIHPLVKANFLASPPLVLAYALAGRIDFDFEREPLGRRADGSPIFLCELWPGEEEIRAVCESHLKRELYSRRYSGIEDSSAAWNSLAVPEGVLFPWNTGSTYIQEPPFFASEGGGLASGGGLRAVRGARVLVMLGDSITTDHISPAGDIDIGSPAGRYLASLGVLPAEFNTYGARRGNDRVMTRGTFANVRLRNLLSAGSEGSATICFLDGGKTDIHTAAERYRAAGVPTIVLAGRDYGMGSSRDWAAKGVYLLGVRAVIAESFERIHRSNLVGMGVLPLQYLDGENAAVLALSGREIFDIDLDADLSPGALLDVRATAPDGPVRAFRLRCRVDTLTEVEYLRNGGLLQTVVGQLSGR